ncbi:MULTISPECIES: PAS domain-containing protein [Mesorhizobium]|uniref:PAS domain-containing protein n=2 Tax=Phyllobacteriaceae TaxID=69277 RepID=UPI0007A9382F|nr:MULTISPECIES: PAS domain-containing protein [Mesorhizobium]AMX97764.1 PAS domain-containing sensor histidine kinase [Mesorhizobium ciceri]MDF3233385.1 PAS domain-containing protein [Mesorhizobium sp. DSM 30133]RUU34822.1 PAS domain S-box protein [Mesorhizobium sp. Primo-A]RVB89030.1 PAS domain S-box protein [Mesorhizobium sp. M7A.F.Ca.AU.002.03.1.1]RVB90434.1 PAS domain S-box protein [Mesorhizobium sp. M7A.F.Ca.AU.002.04.1.1]
MTTAFNSLGDPDAEALRAARLIESVVGNGWATDAAGRFSYVTPSTLSLLGTTLEEFNTSSEDGSAGWKRLIHPDDYDRAVAEWRRCLQTGEHYNVEHRILRASGAYGWSRSSGQPLCDSEGNAVAWYGTLIEGDAPSAATERFADVISAALEKGAASDALHSLSLVHPDDRTAAAHAVARAFWTGVPQVTRHRQLQADGSYRWNETRSEPGYSVSVDIDDLVTDGEPLSGADLDLLVENNAGPIRSAKIVESIFGNGWAFDAAGRWIYLHPFALSSLGVTLEDLNAPLNEGYTAWKRLLHPDDYEQIAVTWRHCLRTGDHFNVEFRFRRANGTYVWARTAARPARDSQGRITGWYGIALDNDVYKKTVAELRGRERELSQLVDMVPVQIRRLTPEGEPTFFNRRLLDFFGLDGVADLDKPGMSRQAAAIQSLVYPEDAARLLETVRHSLATGEPYSMKYRMRRADGAYRWVDGRGEPLRDHSGAIVQWYVISIDVDDEMRAQEALRDRERELSQLVDMVPSFLWRLSASGEPVFFSKRMVEYLGLDVGGYENVGGNGLKAAIAAVVHPDDAATLEAAINHSVTTGESFSLNYRLRRADGVFRWMSGRAEPMRDECGTVVQWYGLSHDIDDQVRAEEALRKANRQLEQMIDAVPVNLLSFAPSGRITYTSKRYLEKVGSPPTHINDFDALARDLAHPEDFPTMFRRASNGFASGQPFMNRFRRREKDGVYRWIEARAQPLRDTDGAIVQWYMASIDIEDEMRAQEALRERERELQQLVDALPVHIWSWTPDGKLAYVNRRSLEDLGISGANFEEFTRVAQELIHPEDAPEVLKRSANCLKTGDSFIMRYRRRWKDGSYRWIEGRCEPLRDRDGAIVHWYQVSIDIDEEMRAQVALRERERSLWQLVETLPVMIDCAAPNGEPIYRSRQLREFLGYELELLDGKGKSRLSGTLDEGVHPDDLAAVKANYAHSLATGEPYARRHRLRRFDGEYCWVDTRAAPMRNAEGAIVQWNVVCLDIDGEVRVQEELRLAQERLARASQAASLAELSASIAHEVNQPLAAVVANSYACQRWLTAEPPNIERAQKTVERIIRDANSAADVVSRIRALFKQSADAMAYTALDSVIAEARDLIAEEAVRRRVRLDLDVESDLPIVALDRVQIQQVLVNLIRNGIEAMDSVPGDKVLGLRVRRIGDAIQIEISDCGPGIEFPDRIFEPFFTTKEHGMGMGLAICRSIVESHGGRLWVEKNDPHGTAFVFTMPVEMKAAA